MGPWARLLQGYADGQIPQIALECCDNSHGDGAVWAFKGLVGTGSPGRVEITPRTGPGVVDFGQHVEERLVYFRILAPSPENGVEYSPSKLATGASPSHTANAYLGSSSAEH